MKNELKEKIFDLVLKEALQESLDRELQEIDEMVASSPPHEVSPQFEKRMKKLTDGHLVLTDSSGRQAETLSALTTL